jgi:hypothetical protein
MFTSQVGQLDALIGKEGVDEQLLQVLKNILGNCAQELTHRGPISYDGPVTYTGPVTFKNITNVTNLSVAGTVLFAKATANWIDGGPVNSSVACAKCDQTGALTGGTVTIYLPSIGAMQPNVRLGDIVAYTVDEDGDAIAVSDYLDDRIGTIKAWNEPNNIPGGWQAIAAGKTIVGYDDADEDFDEVGVTAGTKTHTHDDHDAGDISPHFGGGGSTGSGGGGTLTFSGSTGTATSSGTVSTASSSIEVIPGGSGEVETSEQSKDPTLSGATGYAISEAVTVDDPGHQHDEGTYINAYIGTPSASVMGPPTDKRDSNLTFVGDGTGGSPSTSSFNVAIDRAQVFSGVTVDGDHTHTVTMSDIAGYLKVSAHTHTLTIAGHAHAITGSGTTSSHSHSLPETSHSGSIPHGDPVVHLPPYYVAVWIQRFE